MPGATIGPMVSRPQRAVPSGRRCRSPFLVAGVIAGDPHDFSRQRGPINRTPAREHAHTRIGQRHSDPAAYTTTCAGDQRDGTLRVGLVIQ